MFQVRLDLDFSTKLMFEMRFADLPLVHNFDRDNELRTPYPCKMNSSELSSTKLFETLQVVACAIASSNICLYSLGGK